MSRGRSAPPARAGAPDPASPPAVTRERVPPCCGQHDDQRKPAASSPNPSDRQTLGYCRDASCPAPDPGVASHGGRARRRHPPDHDAAADAAGPRALLPPAGRGRLDARRHRGSACRTRRRSGSESLDGAEVARIFVTHFHPDHVGAAADVAELTRAPVHQGALDYAQCELVWGNPNWPRADRRLVPHPRRPGRDHGGADRLRRRLPALHPLPARPDPRSTTATGSTAGSSSPRPATPTGSSACSRTACSSRPTTCSAGSRRPSASGRRAAPTRSATSSSRSSGRSSSRPRSRSPATATRSPIPSAAPAS